MELLPSKIQKKTGKRVRNWRILKESIDARKKNDIRIVYSVEFNYDPKDEIGRMDIPSVTSETRPVIAGFGPCGIFAALVLARAGLKPIVLERGMDVDRRTEQVERFGKKANSIPSPTFNSVRAEQEHFQTASSPRASRIPR